MMLRPLTASCLCLAMWAAPALSQNGEPTFNPSSVITTALDELEDVRELVNEAQEADPEGGWFTRSSQDVQEDLDDHLDDLLAAILGDHYRETREELLDADERISEIEESMDDLQVARQRAPSSADAMTRFDSVLMRDVAPGSREAIDDELQALDAEMENLVSHREDIESDFRRRLAINFDVYLEPNQARAILYQINGRSIVEASIAHSVLQQVAERLGEIRSSVKSNASLRRYYGVAAMMRLITVRLYERHLIDYRDDWKPSIEEFVTNHSELIDETRNLIANARSQAHAESLRNNLAIQRQTAKVASDYSNLLYQRELLVKDRLDAAIADAALALNTLQTLDSATVLFDQFASNEAEFQAMMEIESSELIPLEDGDLAENFLEISRTLSGS